MDNTNAAKKTLTSKLTATQTALDAGLKQGLAYAELFRTLTTTQDNQQLLDAANQLYAFVVDSDSVIFPKKFEASDYYLIFMTRLIELSGLNTKLALDVENAGDHQVLYHLWDGSNQRFRFEVQNGNVKYVDQISKQTIFSLNLSAKKMSFETDTINNFYFLNQESDKQTSLFDEIKLFTKFGQILESTYGFNVDFNMFDARNRKVYEFNQTGLKPEITDELFVDAAKNHWTLLNGENFEGGYLELSNQVIFSIFKVNPATDQWAVKVADPNEKYALFDVLKKYDFLNDWYVRNIADLKLKMLF
jgi:hypothetical protein